MRLTTLRLAGFKSFIEPTELHFPSELVGIVGPNGCGKSNTLDALRWVMGESSARNLRGQSLDDVIFAGSAQRKPVAQASVELVFEHHEDDASTLQGNWARFRDLSIRRVMTRDGQSKYFLNGTRCRRKDIADLFLGTGLGRGHGSTSATRSYAIIEQGQINRLLDARPDELRATLEEAAGISRYKERRRETELSIQHTRDNLARINDLGDELTRQLDKLERQAKAAERLRLWQGEASQLELALDALQLQRLQTESEHERAQQASEEAEQRNALAMHQSNQQHLAALQAQNAALQAELHHTQAQSYTLAADIAQTEQARRHAFSQSEQIERELQQLAQESAQHTHRLNDARAQLAQLALDVAAANAALAPAGEQLAQTHATLQTLEQHASQARLALEQLQSRMQEPAQQLRVERNQLAHTEQQQRQLHDRLQRLRISQLENETLILERDSAAALRAHAEFGAGLAALEQAQEQHASELAATRLTLLEREAHAARLHGEIQSIGAEQRALLALEQTQSSDVAPALRAWLKRNRLEQRRAADVVRASPEWLAPLDEALGDALQAVPVETLDAWRNLADDPAARGLRLVEKAERPYSEDRDPTHAPMLEGDYALGLLGGLRPCSDLDSALARRHELPPGAAWLTPQGDRVSRHLWERPPATSHNHGALQRRQRLEQLADELAQLRPAHQEAEAQRTTTRQALAALEAEQHTFQREHRDALRQQHEQALRSEQLRLRLEQTQTRLHSQHREREELHEALQHNAAQHARQQHQVNALEHQLHRHEDELSAARLAREQAEQALNRQRQQLREAERAEQSAQSRLHTLLREHELRVNSVDQLAEQSKHLDARLGALLQRQNEAIAPQSALTARLEQLREAEKDATQALQQARDALNRHTESARAGQQALMHSEQTLEQTRRKLEQRRLNLQALELRMETPAARLAAADPEAIRAALRLTQGNDIDAAQTRLHETQARIARLGPVNLTALSEFEEARQQQNQLEAQRRDLNEALTTLETAMRTMDQETRSRFRETFEAVNAKLGETFSRLFGGGEARLELLSEPLSDSDDASHPRKDPWLDHGLVLLARPPGKKISHIHLLSGGEKSLTAIALVFAIFQLNPAPFCLLDEVDAPLDEANVGRFCAMVQAMSARVQFIFITHNKTTMELAKNLIGVTMREAGVSRIVEVDLDAAVKMLDE